MDEYATEHALKDQKRKGISDGNQRDVFDKVPKEVDHNTNFKWRQLQNTQFISVFSRYGKIRR
jgi:hypothetical protein